MGLPSKFDYAKFDPVSLTSLNFVHPVSCVKCNKFAPNDWLIKSAYLQQFQAQFMCLSCYDLYDERQLAKARLREVEYELVVSEQISKNCEICNTLVYDAETRKRQRLEYDHKDVFDKGATIGNIVAEGGSIDQMKEEIKKCRVLCSACHGKITQLQQASGLIYVKNYTDLEQLPAHIRESVEKHMVAVQQKIIRDVHAWRIGKWRPWRLGSGDRGYYIE
jgi:hypothetical protein